MFLLFQVPCGAVATDTMTSEYVPNRYHDGLIADLMTSHMVHDFCIVGPRVRRFVLLVSLLSNILKMEKKQKNIIIECLILMKGC